MIRRIGLVRTCAIGVVLSGAGWVSTAALAQTATTATSAPAQTAPAADPLSSWWFHGAVEAGGRFFLNDPQRNGSAYLNQNSLAKYYEYSTIKPGPFSNIWLATGSKDGLYQADFWGWNIGYSDQKYSLDLSKAGRHYLSFGWDQTPHLYSTSAQTFYQGVGTNVLTLPSGFVKGTTAANIVPFLQPIDVGIKRDTASVEYRWTPNDAWDIKTDFSHLRRTGTQVDGVTGFGSSAFSSPTQVPKPVADTTQNYGVNGEYVGTSAWGQRYTFKLGYKGSQYTDDYAAYTVQGLYSNGTIPLAQISLPPSNRADAFNGTLAADLPWRSRYAGTLSYTMMRQDAAFIPMSVNANFALPASSLNGAINTLLSNNVLTTKVTPELTSKLSYRYYDFQNNTPEILFAPAGCQVAGATNGTCWASYDRTTRAEIAIQSLSVAYTKQNAGEELTWRPSREWTLGAAYGYERYSYTRADANVTNENSGKVFADWKPTNWLTARSSVYYSNRRYDTYSYTNFVSNIQFPGVGQGSGWIYQSSYRQLMLDNRERWKANFAVDIVALRGLTITPNFKYQDDNYSVNPINQQGLEDSRSWNAGVDVTYVINPATSIMVGYLREYYTQLLYGASCTSGLCPIAGSYQTQTNDRTVVDTVTALVRYAAIPNKLDTELRYTASRGVDRTNLFLGTTSGLSATGQFPDYTTWFQRLDATAAYKLDPTLVTQLGWMGEVKVKFRYVWERNSVSNWSNDPLAAYSPSINTTSVWLAGNNPNYNVHLMMVSLASKW